MANSSDVTAGNDAKASEYNNLRADVLDGTTGHNHSSGSGKVITEISPSVSFIDGGSVGRNYSIHATEFVPLDHNQQYVKSTAVLEPSSNTVPAYFFAPVHLPQGAVLASIIAYVYRDNGTSTLELVLYKMNLSTHTPTAIKTMTSASTAGDHTLTESSIGETINNATHAYYFYLTLDPDGDYTNVRMYGITLEYDITQPLP